MSDSYIAALEAENYRLRAENEELKRQFQTFIKGAVKEAVEEAVRPLQDRIESLEATVAAQDKRISEIDAQQLRDVDKLALDIAYDRQRIAALEHVPAPGPTPIEKERIEKIEYLCTNAPGHTISLPELRGRLGIDKAVLSRLLKKIDGDKFYLRKSTTDKRIRYLCLRPVVR